jgi:hypothetical protein
VGKDIRIGVPFEPDPVGNRDAAQNQGPALHQAVRIVSKTDPEQNSFLF